MLLLIFLKILQYSNTSIQQGDTNRAVSETPMNLASSRSHCVFTIYVEARQEGSAIVRRSKLHIVDLAG